MEPLLSVELPPELDNYTRQIESTVKPYIKITAKPESDISPWQSKFGGVPYLPIGVQYPRSSNGQPLCLLAQINFDEIPRLESFPDHGILQFYIADDDLCGLQFENLTKQENFRIFYFPEIIKENIATDFDFLPSFKFVPVSELCSLAFELDQQPISAYDYRFEDKIFNGDIPDPK